MYSLLRLTLSMACNLLIRVDGCDYHPELTVQRNIQSAV
uniref:Uncharacterized protein n=1 Tax=Anguilla anguilla TaxID=7936 RepID=A0A0E9R2D0_ANGAN